MIKNFFGPFPDEPLLYGFDKILGLFYKFNSKLECSDGETQIDTPVPVDEKINEVINETTTASENVTGETVANETTAENNVRSVTLMEKISMEIVETSSHTSKRTIVVDSNQMNEPVELPKETKRISVPKSILKTTSSMECNFPLSKLCLVKKSVHTSSVSSNKKTNRFTQSSTKKYTQTKGFGDSVTVVQDKFEKKFSRSDGRNRFESTLKQDTKQRKIQTSPDIIRLERSVNQTLNELKSRSLKAAKNVKLKDRKVTKTEWALTRIHTFDDDSQTYEIIKKDKVLDRNGGIEKIFAIAPNLTTVAYNPCEDKKR